MARSNGDRSAPEDNKEMKRVQLDLPPRAMERLLKLKDDTEASTYAEVIRNSLKLYAEAVEQYKAGNEFMLKQPDGTIMPALIFKP